MRRVPPLALCRRPLRELHSESQPQRPIHVQPFAGQQDPGLAQQTDRGCDGLGFSGPGGQSRPCAGDRQRLFYSPRRGALCPHFGVARQPGPCARPKRRLAGLQRACAEHLGQSGRCGARPGQAAPIGPIAGDDARRVGAQAQGRRKNLCLAAPSDGRAGGQGHSGAGHQGCLRHQGIQASVSRGGSGRAHRGLHQCGRQGPRGCGADFPKATGGSGWLAPRDQGPTGPRGGGRG